MFSLPSYAEWTKVSENIDGVNYYVDLNRIRKHDGYVFYWELVDLVKPSSEGYLSYRIYKKVDCDLMRFISLDETDYKEHMGRGIGDKPTPSDNWYYSPPGSSSEQTLTAVCRR